MKLRQVRKKLSNTDCELLETVFYVYVNNDSVKYFSSEQDVLDYVRNYLEFNSIFSFNVYKTQLLKL